MLDVKDEETCIIGLARAQADRLAAGPGRRVVHVDTHVDGSGVGLDEPIRLGVGLRDVLDVAVGGVAISEEREHVEELGGLVVIGKGVGGHARANEGGGREGESSCERSHDDRWFDEEMKWKMLLARRLEKND